MNGADEQTECRESKECAAPKHHFDECVERVTAAEDKGGSKEDCVEECKFPRLFFRSRSVARVVGAVSREWMGGYCRGGWKGLCHDGLMDVC